MSVYDPSLLSQFLPQYYKRIFPFKPYVKWLCYNQKPADYFARREFAFILEGDVHLRYRCFEDQAEFERELCKISPHKLDIGAVYSHKPKENKKHSDFKAVERELVFDIDLTDYDNVRKCCTEAKVCAKCWRFVSLAVQVLDKLLEGMHLLSGHLNEAKVCAKCWRFVSLAVQVLDKLLEDHFGFKARMWVFSGRRGVHCWVGDEKARKLTNAGRSAVAEYLSLIVGDKLDIYGNRTSMAKKLLPVHPMVETAYRVAMECGEMDEMVLEQGWLELDSALAILKHCEDPELQATLRSQFEEVDSPAMRWQLLKRRFDDNYRKEMKRSNQVIPEPVSGVSRNFLRWFVLWHAYPRLDVNVSTGLNHLLKSPFCIHPKTGNVAVPLDVSKISEFDVTTCPRVDILINELSKNAADEDVKENRKILGYKHTSLAPYVENFEKFVELAVTS
ncbi:DNA primase small subunit [Cooperia oncophora]